jgi:putative protease
MNTPELLAPAATFSCAQAAIANGADAVYAGLATHNLRARSSNFATDELDDLFECAHDQGKRVYVALNVLPDDSRIDQIDRSLKDLSSLRRRPDAIIVADPGVIELCRRRVPDVPLHLSTQTGTFNSVSARFWANQGIRRVILPREMSLSEIGKIATAGFCETEVFIHGAMCVSISGRCLLGAYRGKRHPNFGDCPQPCRLRYRIAPLQGTSIDGEKEPEWYTVEENPDSGAFILNSKDLNALPVLDRIVSSGVTALKIEGRHRSLHYVASVVKVYRAALDSLAHGTGAYVPLSEWHDELDRLDHRPYTTGFYAGDYALQDLRRPQDDRQGGGYRVVGVVREEIDGQGFVVDVKNPFLVSDPLNVLCTGHGPLARDAAILKMMDMNGNGIGKALTNRVVICATEPALRVGDILRKKVNACPG